MIISGFQKSDLTNYPGIIAASVFVKGCNMVCPYCHNPSLVTGSATEEHSEDEIFEYLEKRKNFIEGLVVSGGEPTLYDDLSDFAVKVKKLGMKVKLDTNGTNFEMLKNLVEKKLVDYVAMDIKAPFENYHQFVKKDAEQIAATVKESAEFLKKASVSGEFRTTSPKGLLNRDSFLKIADFLKDTDKIWYLQVFNPRETLNPEMQKAVSFSKEELQQIATEIKSIKVKVRG